MVFVHVDWSDEDIYKFPLQKTRLDEQDIVASLQFDLTFYESMQPDQLFVDNALYFAISLSIADGSNFYDFFRVTNGNAADAADVTVAG